MKCISLYQPWASLVVLGAKRFETRSWERLYRGPLLIHAAKKWNGELKGMCFDEPFASAICKARPNRGGEFYLADILDELIPRGAIIGRVRVVKSWRTRGVSPSISKTEAAFGDYGDGRFAMELSDPAMFEKPIPYRGSQGFFEVPDDVVAAWINSGKGVRL